MNHIDLIGTLIEAWPLLWNGLKMTVYVTVVSLVIAMILGILVCRRSLPRPHPSTFELIPVPIIRSAKRRRRSPAVRYACAAYV